MRVSRHRRGSVRARAGATALVVVTGALGAAAGWLGGSQLQEDATAEATLFLNPLDGNAFYPGGAGEDLVHLVTEAELLRSDAMATAVAEATGADGDPRAVLVGLDVSVPPNTQILDIGYEHPDPEVALSRAQSFADQYLEYRRARAENLRTERQERIGAEITALETQLAELATQLAAVDPGSADASLLAQKMQSVSDQVTQLNARMTDIATTSLEPGQVVTPAELAPPGLLSASTAATAVGGALGAGAAFGVLQVLRRRRLAGTEGPEAAVLGSVPPMAASSTLPWTPDSVTDAHRLLRAHFLRSVANGSGDVVVVLPQRTGPLTGVDTVVPLATALGLAGVRTVVVDTTGAVPARPGVTQGPGLGELLRGEARLDDVVDAVAPHVRLVPAGRHPERVRDLLTGRRMTATVAGLRATADVVLVVSDALDTVVGQSLASLLPAYLVEVPAPRASGRGQAVAGIDLPSLLLGVVEVLVDGHERGRHERRGPFAQLAGTWRARAADAGHAPATPDDEQTLPGQHRPRDEALVSRGHEDRQEDVVGDLGLLDDPEALGPIGTLEHDPFGDVEALEAATVGDHGDHGGPSRA